MGYSTDFSGRFDVTPPLSRDMVAYLDNFAGTRRMLRDPEVIKEIYPDWEDDCFFGELGVDGEYFVGAGGDFGQAHDDSIIDYNRPPADQPGLWCQWVPTDDGTALEWDQGEKFYAYVPWLYYLMEHFLIPNGYTLNGTVHYEGEDRDDVGDIIVEDNCVSVVTPF